MHHNPCKSSLCQIYRWSFSYQQHSIANKSWVTPPELPESLLLPTASIFSLFRISTYFIYKQKQFRISSGCLLDKNLFTFFLSSLDVDPRGKWTSNGDNKALKSSTKKQLQRSPLNLNPRGPTKFVLIMRCSNYEMF